MRAARRLGASHGCARPVARVARSRSRDAKRRRGRKTKGAFGRGAGAGRGVTMQIDSTINTTGSVASATGAATGKSKNLGENDFLRLLVAQLSHQDPLNPTDDTAFVAQLAQFS